MSANDDMAGQPVRKTRRLLVRIMVLGIVAAGFATCCLHRTVAEKRINPSGEYCAEISYCTFLGYLPMGPGQGSDKPGFVEIFNLNGESQGWVGIPMLWVADDLRWTDHGATVNTKAVWDFEKRTCFYYDEMRNDAKVWTRGHE
jgi:hypothetical protein